MGAAENDGIDAFGDHRRDVFGDGGDDFGAVENTLFDKRHEFWARLSEDAELAGVSGDEAVKFFAREGGFGGENADDAGFAGGGGGLDARFHADKRQRISVAQSFDGGDGGRVASDDDELRTLRDEKISEGKNALLDFARGLAAIRTPRRITHVMDRFVRENFLDFAQNGQAANARIKDA